MGGAEIRAIKKMNTLGKILAWVGIGYVALVFALSVFMFSTDPGALETQKMVAAEMAKYDPRKVSYEEWKPHMHLWTDIGSANYSAVMDEEARRKAYENARHPLRTHARVAGQVFIGFAILGLISGGMAWIGATIDMKS
ncbi:MAG: hypothetical protein NUV42_02975 [Candidatus Yonathbacteria bacterium]|nr:hypothetical protein [Candidatus Yonathbacteria bacterium]